MNSGEKKDSSSSLRRKREEKRAQFYALRTSRERLDTVLSDPEGEILVRSLPPVELHLFTREVDPEDRTTLVEMASMDQIQRMMDFSCWEKDVLNMDSLNQWIQILRDCGPAKLAKALENMDTELWVLFLRHYLEVGKTEDDRELMEEERSYDFTLDDLYFFRYKCSDDDQPLVYQCIEELYRLGSARTQLILEAALGEMDGPLQEEAYRLRQGRMEESGFPDYFEALRIYQIQNRSPDLKEEPPKPIDFPEKDSKAPDEFPPRYALVFADSGPSFLKRTLEQGIPSERMEHLWWELTYLCHKVFIADQVDLGDREEITQALARTHDLLSLSLENLSAGRLEQSRFLLQEHFAETIFRAGYNLTQRLRQRALALIRQGWLALAPGLSFLDPPSEDVLRGLDHRHPRFPLVLDPGGNPGFRDLKTLEDLTCMERELSIIESIGEVLPFLLNSSWPQIFRLDLAGCLPDSWQEMQLSTLFLTGFANEQLGHGFHLLPVHARDLKHLHHGCREHEAPVLKKEIKKRFETDLGRCFGSDSARLAGAIDYVRRCWRIFEEEFLSINPHESIDPRFIRSLLVRG